MWSGLIHDKEFISKVLDHVESNESKYGTVARMKGMLTVAKEVRTLLCIYHGRQRLMPLSLGA